jgi:GNAT superfamily N-acetyltransferase
MSKLQFYPLTPARWADFTELFGENGACGGCWCMFWRQTRQEFTQQKGEKNKNAIHRIVESGTIPGIIAYYQGHPVGWCSLGPRESFSSLQRSKVLQSPDNQAIWSIVCFFIAKSARKQGVMRYLLQGAIQFAKDKGAQILEAYPVETERKLSSAEIYMGTPAVFRALGFQEVIRRSPIRPILRLTLTTK